MTLTRDGLVQELQAKGFTYRESRRLIGAICDAMVAIFKRDHILDFPFGTMYLVEPNPVRAYRFGKIARRNRKRKVHFRSKND